MMIKKANATATKYACEKFHYAQATPAVSYSYNIYNDKNEWCGTICYGHSATPTIAKHFGLAQGEILELVRVALNGKQEHTSKAVALSLKKIHQDAPLVKMIVSYADMAQHHLGTIYQATNWIYTGISYGTAKEYFYKGKWLHPRTLTTIPNHQKLKKYLPSRMVSNKFRYIFCFDKKLKKQYTKLAQPYPKDKDFTENIRG